MLAGELVSCSLGGVSDGRVGGGVSYDVAWAAGAPSSQARSDEGEAMGEDFR